MREYKEFFIPIGKPEKRALELEKAIDIFSKKYYDKTGETLKVIDKASQHITELYFTYLFKEVKRYVPKRINKYKIASLTELCIVNVQPFLFDDQLKQRQINSEFAFFCTLTIYMGMSGNIDSFNKITIHKRVEDVFESSKKQRLLWLASKDINNFPVFSNALSLALLFELYSLRFHAFPV